LDKSIQSCFRISRYILIFVVPLLLLILYYSGEQHYYDIYNAFGPGSTTKMFYERDQEKKEMCNRKGINLVCIPYWYVDNGILLSYYEKNSDLIK
jgi:hypothetical protein